MLFRKTAVSVGIMQPQFDQLTPRPCQINGCLVAHKMPPCGTNATQGWFPNLRRAPRYPAALWKKISLANLGLGGEQKKVAIDIHKIRNRFPLHVH
jgi:hypothetical protein